MSQIKMNSEPQKSTVDETQITWLLFLLKIQLQKHRKDPEATLTLQSIVLYTLHQIKINQAFNIGNTIQ